MALLRTSGTHVIVRRAAWVAVALLVSAALVTGFYLWRVEGLRWRVQVVLLAAAGRIPDLSALDALRMIEPGSKQWLHDLPATRNAYTAISNPSTSEVDVATGAALFRTNCAGCHGANGGGYEAAPALKGRTFAHGDSDWALYRTIVRGVPGTAMPPHAWGATPVWQVVAYLRSLNPQIPGAYALAAATSRTAAVSMSYAELAAAAEPAEDWPTYSGSYSAVRHSVLARIDRANVERLAPRWMYQFDRTGDPIEASPLVRNGVMYLADPGRVVALDARTGQRLWEFLRSVPTDVRLCCANATRGVAILDDRLFVGTADAHLIALSARTGRLLWDVAVVDDYAQGYSITGAPLAYRDLVATGIAGGDYPTRGFIAAFDAATGKQRWRFYTIPAPGEPGHETWTGDAWRRGGGGTWLTGSYDPAQDLLYWGVGNPAPAFDASVRPGDNLYTDSVVALRGSTGERVWHFQFFPGENFNWDANQIPVIVDRAASTRPHELLCANRNGFFYVLDRDTGRFVLGTPFVRQTWAQRLTELGRPIRAPGASPSPKGTLIYPGGTGGTNWYPPSYDPDLDLLIVPALERAGLFFTSTREPPQQGEKYLGGATEPAPGLAYSKVVAIRPADGSIAWEHRTPARNEEARSAGLMSTRGGLVFAADDQTFYALDSSNGRLLWSFASGARIIAAPITYAVDGKQYVATASGHTIITFALVDHVETTRP
jgi:alcohol dehydrogenase (cytochrome c)